MTNIELTDDFLEAAVELRYVTAEIAKLETQAKHCKEILAKHLIVGDIGTDANGHALVKMQKGSARFKPELAKANLPADVLASIMVTAPDGKRAKDILAPALYELTCSEDAPSIRVA
jgi:hypothetical protein